MKSNTAVIFTALILLCNGCCCFPFLYPKTGASGLVVDQDNVPVPDAQMKASWIKRSYHDVMMAGHVIRHFNSDANGRWMFFSRDAEDMFITAESASGYESESLGFDAMRVGPLTNGDSRANVLLHLHKVEMPPVLKATK